MTKTLLDIFLCLLFVDGILFALITLYAIITTPFKEAARKKELERTKEHLQVLIEKLKEKEK